MKRVPRWPAVCSGALALLSAFGLFLAADVPTGAALGPRSPREELATFRLAKGFKIELVASEPEVIDPVALAFDENGRLYVAEMRGYPNGGVATGEVATGKIKRLEDRDGDGVFETSTVYADGLRFPSSVMPWKGGLLVAVAPDIVYFEDPDGDGKADRKRVLYTGFDLSNIQQIINGLQWGLDNWVYGIAGSKGGDIRSVEKPDAPPVQLRGRGARFHPERPGSLEPMSGGGQFGLAPDDGQHWFTATNSQHLRQIVLPDHYLRRNPYLAVGAVTLDIPDHGASCKVYRLSPFEGWRVERTQRRAGSKDAKRFASTELVPGGFITSGCGPVAYTASLFPEAYRGNTFVCDPANNLVHRDQLVSRGSTFVAKRADADCEFFASTDNWCRPVNLCVGPDGAIYMVDFYREVIETPLSLPDDIKQRLNLESRGRGRIWRIAPEGTPPLKSPALGQASAAELVQHLASDVPWRRLTAQRLLLERQDKSAVKPLEDLARASKAAVGRFHALWTLRGLGALSDTLIEAALKDPDAGVREQALRLAEARLGSATTLQALALKLVNDPAPEVRFQLAFSLGEIDSPEAAAALARLVRKDGDDTWFQMAVLSSSSRTAPGLLASLAADKDYVAGLTPARTQLFSRLAAQVGARPNDDDLARALMLLGEGSGGEAWKVAVLEGLGQGLQNSQRSLRRLWEQPPPALKEAVTRARPFFEQAARTAADEQRKLPARLAAVRLLASGPFSTAGPALQQLLSPQNPSDVQLAAVRALSAQDHPDVAGKLLAAWTGYSPNLRREVLEALFARADRLRQLLDAVEKKTVLASQIESARVEQLRKHPDAKVRQRAQALFSGPAVSNRKQAVEDYRPALDLTGDPARGKALFKKTCSVCHRLENEGHEVGADLQAALRTKTREALLNDILDPSKEVDPRYINYLVTTKAGRLFTGLIAVESPSSVTLRRAERAEDTILRSQIDEIQATDKSVMPEELEKQLSKQDLADVIAYLMSVGSK